MDVVENPFPLGREVFCAVFFGASDGADAIEEEIDSRLIGFVLKQLDELREGIEAKCSPGIGAASEVVFGVDGFAFVGSFIAGAASFDLDEGNALLGFFRVGSDVLGPFGNQAAEGCFVLGVEVVGVAVPLVVVFLLLTHGQDFGHALLINPIGCFWANAEREVNKLLVFVRFFHGLIQTAPIVLQGHGFDFTPCLVEGATADKWELGGVKFSRAIPHTKGGRGWGGVEE